MAASGRPVLKSIELFLGMAEMSMSEPVTAVAATSPLLTSFDEMFEPPLALLVLTCHAMLERAFSIFEPSLRYSE
jgi:hypothetical protein